MRGYHCALPPSWPTCEVVQSERPHHLGKPTSLHKSLPQMDGHDGPLDAAFGSTNVSSAASFVFDRQEVSDARNRFFVAGRCGFRLPPAAHFRPFDTSSLRTLLFGGCGRLFCRLQTGTMAFTIYWMAADHSCSRRDFIRIRFENAIRRLLAYVLGYWAFGVLVFRFGVPAAAEGLCLDSTIFLRYLSDAHVCFVDGIYFIEESTRVGSLHCGSDTERWTTSDVVRIA